MKRKSAENKDITLHHLNIKIHVHKQYIMIVSICVLSFIVETVCKCSFLISLCCCYFL